MGKHGSFALSAEGASPITFKESGALPEGVKFTDNGSGSATLAGTPAAGTAGTYEFAITASDGVEPEATQTFTLTVNDVPGAPQDVEASSGTDSATVSWSPPSSDGNSPIESYVVTANPGGKSVTVAGSEVSARIEGLSAGNGVHVQRGGEERAGRRPGRGLGSSGADVHPDREPGVGDEHHTRRDRDHRTGHHVRREHRDRIG